MTKRDLWIGMQPDEDVAVADCGCTLYRSGDSAPDVEGAGANDDPLYVQCALHDAAPELLAQLKMLVRWAEDQGEACEFARRAIARAEGKVGQ